MGLVQVMIKWRMQGEGCWVSAPPTLYLTPKSTSQSELSFSSSPALCFYTKRAYLAVLPHLLGFLQHSRRASPLCSFLTPTLLLSAASGQKICRYNVSNKENILLCEVLFLRGCTTQLQQSLLLRPQPGQTELHSTQLLWRNQEWLGKWELHQ